MQSLIDNLGTKSEEGNHVSPVKARRRERQQRQGCLLSVAKRASQLHNQGRARARSCSPPRTKTKLRKVAPLFCPNRKRSISAAAAAAAFTVVPASYEFGAGAELIGVSRTRKVRDERASCEYRVVQKVGARFREKFSLVTASPGQPCQAGA